MTIWIAFIFFGYKSWIFVRFKRILKNCQDKKSGFLPICVWDTEKINPILSSSIILNLMAKKCILFFVYPEIRHNWVQEPRRNFPPAKGQLISKANCQAVNSSKNRTNEFVFTTMRRVFVRFLEEIEDTKKTFRNYLTFR